MELWIRSQDKEALRKINDIEIDYLNFKKYSYTKDIESKGEYSIRGNGETLGQYKTKERALEVLDEIQNKFKIICTNSTGGEYMLAKNLIPIVYEMPEE